MKTIRVNSVGPLRGCSYAGEQPLLCGLVHQGEISLSLRNSYKNMWSEPACLRDISLDFAGIPPRWDENFPY